MTNYFLLAEMGFHTKKHIKHINQIKNRVKHISHEHLQLIKAFDA